MPRGKDPRDRKPVPHGRRFFAIDGANQLVAAFGREIRRRNQPVAVQLGRQRPLPFEFVAASGAGLQVFFHAVLDSRLQLAVIIKRNRFGYRIARHTKSPKTTRIF